MFFLLYNFNKIYSLYQRPYASNGKILAIDGLPEGDYPKEVFCF